MGHSSSKIKRIRRSFRRLSLSKSFENLRHAKSLTTLGKPEKRRNTMIDMEKPEMASECEGVRTVSDCEGVRNLRLIDERLSEMEKQIEEMCHDDLFVYHSTFKDEIHNFWIKAYEIKEANDNVKPKKHETIDYAKKLLHKLNGKMFERSFKHDSFC